ncbi:hypothetical protein EAT51_02880 [Pseudoxanthomonas winnipegensis]|uniref:GtrA family protein n=1 Tax=Pseudoxanthomonas winnipegensis TaxID=2480810 RepID=UPI00102E0B62|nr:GtrA family protein [Pseudoxanthomonas winnipegensis]TAA44347.1 hypothetical protein EAT51_02880 [Pseudoxanthomonas winnipegensis]
MKLLLPQWRETRRALSFVLLSGLGWCMDMFLFYWLIHTSLSSPGLANVASATIAAMAVFMVSRVLVFGDRRRGMKGMLGYLLYTELNILASAAAIEGIARYFYMVHGFQFAATAIVAKVLVTPLSLVCNFLVTRWLSGSRVNG